MGLWRSITLVILGLILSGGSALALDPALVELEEERFRLLLSRLNLEYPGLEDVQAAAKRDDLYGAMVALLTYYREKPTPAQVLSRPFTGERWVLDQAADAVEDTFTLQGITARQQSLPNGQIDWSHRGPRNDQEWAWLLNRHLHFRFLLVAWERTGDAVYLETINRHLISWIRQNPHPGRRSYSAAWRVLEAGRRLLDSWVDVFYLLRDEPALTDEARLLMLSSIPENANQLRRFHARGGNHLLTENLALTNTALAWPEFADAEEWLYYALGTIQEEMFAQSYPDGAYKELANHYQRVILVTLQRWYELVDAHRPEIITPELRIRMEALWNYFALVMKPDGTGPLNNDSDLENNRAFLEKVVDYFDREDWRFALSNGQKGSWPQETYSWFFPWAGQAIMRNHWGRNGDWAYFEMGPYGTDHQHRDRLHLTLMVGGKPFLVDAGRYTYVPGLAREYFRGPRSHNLILRNGQGTLRPPRIHTAPIEQGWEITPRHAYFTARADFPSQPLAGQGRAFHQRTVYFEPDRFWIVLDEVTGFGPQEWTVQWRFHPDTSIEIRPDGNLLAQNETARLHMVPVTTRPWAVEKFSGIETNRQFAGWYSPQYNVKYPAFDFHFQTRSTGPRQWAWVFFPDPEGTLEQVAVEASPSRPGEPLHLTISRDGQTWNRTISSRQLPSQAQSP